MRRRDLDGVSAEVRRTTILDGLRRLDWQVEESDAPFGRPKVLQERYPPLPRAMTEFLDGLEACENPDETTWFLTRADYRPDVDTAFPWDAWERMTLEEETGTAAAEAVAFWDRHLPILLGVGSDYAYLGLQVQGGAFGPVVKGYAPGFEETLVVAPTFDGFLELMLDALFAPDPARSIESLLP